MAERILVVDDNYLNLKLACDILIGEGYIVDRAATANDALGRLSAHVPDLILTDLALPGIDGVDLIRAFRGRRDTARTPILALTASAMKRDEERARDAGCDAFLVKPIDTRALPGLIRRLLAGSRP